MYERWDGKGTPRGLKGEAVARSTRVVALAQDAVTFHRLGGSEAAVAMVKKRKGGAYDPAIAERFARDADRLFRGFTLEPSWQEVLDLEPGERAVLSDDAFDTACQVIADFTDIKSPYTLGHSGGVALLVSNAARCCGLPESDQVALRRAGLLHDIGRVGVSAGVWGKPGPLSEREWERVRMSPHHTERVLARSPILARLGSVAGAHCERLDGSGYYRGVNASGIGMLARLLAAADAYRAMLEPRAHRPAQTPDEAAKILHLEVRTGRLDPDAVNAVLESAGHARPARTERIAGLSERELEVLRLIARGQATKQMARALGISPKTADHHIQHVYTKIGVSTRAGATLWAMEKNLLETE